MDTKQFLALRKLWLLLLLLSNIAVAHTSMVIEPCQESKTVTLFEAETSLHKEGLQPQIPSFRIISEHHAKPISFGYPELFYDADCHFVTKSVGLIQVFLQDVNRCESVSPFLFPYHFFW